MNAMGNVRSTGGSFRATDQATPVETAAQNPELQATEPVKSPAPFAGNTITLEAHLSEGISKANIELQGLLSPKSNAKNKGQLIENIRARISNLEQQLQTAKQGGTNGLLTPTTNGTSEAGTAGPVGVETGPEVANAQGGAGTAANAGPNGNATPGTTESAAFPGDVSIPGASSDTNAPPGSRIGSLHSDAAASTTGPAAIRSPTDPSAFDPTKERHCP